MPTLLHDAVGSVLFYVAMLIAAVLLGLGTLAPRWLVQQQLEQQVAQSRQELAARESQCLKLEQAVAALRSDPRFVEQLARRQLGRSATNDERIPLVDNSLNFSIDALLEEPHGAGAPHKVEPAEAALRPLAELVSAHPQLRTGFMAAAALIALAAFALLTETPATARWVERSVIAGYLASLAGRYTR